VEVDGMSSIQSHAWQLYVLCSAILGVQLLLLALWTGTVRVLRKQWVNPEDARLGKGERTEADHPDVQRAKRAHLNALENAVPFFVIGLAYALLAPSQLAAQAYFWSFTLARLFHSLFYLLGLQPWRTLSFAIGVLSTFGMAFHVIRAAV
jgi:uncharacterized MAPEG superfamily protein